MAISLKTSGAWVEATADATVTLVGSPAAGDRYFIFASWKDYAITAQISGWTEVAEWADGTVSTGNGTGSMKVGCWYRDWQNGDGNPTLDFSSNPTVGQYVCQLWQKAANENWDTPTYVTAALPAPASGALHGRDASAAANVPNGSVVFNLIGVRDDSATFTRTATSVKGWVEYATDSFTRADSTTSAGPAWSLPTGTSGAAGVSSNKWYQPATAIGSAVSTIHSTQAAGDDAKVMATLSSLAGATTNECSISFMCNGGVSGATDACLLVVHDSNVYLRTMNWNGDNQVARFSDVAVSWAENDVWSIERVGNVYTTRLNGLIPIGATWTDSGNAMPRDSSHRNCGLGNYRGAVTSGVRWDDFKILNPVTWVGNYVESPATHASSTTGNDMSCDLGHRFVTTGGSAVWLQTEATLSAAETAASLWVVQSVSPGTQNYTGDAASTVTATAAATANTAGLTAAASSVTVTAAATAVTAQKTDAARSVTATAAATLALGQTLTAAQTGTASGAATATPNHLVDAASQVTATTAGTAKLDGVTNAAQPVTATASVTDILGRPADTAQTATATAAATTLAALLADAAQTVTATAAATATVTSNYIADAALETVADTAATVDADHPVDGAFEATVEATADATVTSTDTADTALEVVADSAATIDADHIVDAELTVTADGAATATTDHPADIALTVTADMAATVDTASVVDAALEIVATAAADADVSTGGAETIDAALETVADTAATVDADHPVDAAVEATATAAAAAVRGIPADAAETVTTTPTAEAVRGAKADTTQTVTADRTADAVRGAQANAAQSVTATAAAAAQLDGVADTALSVTAAAAGELEVVGHPESDTAQTVTATAVAGLTLVSTIDAATTVTVTRRNGLKLSPLLTRTLVVTSTNKLLTVSGRIIAHTT